MGGIDLTGQRFGKLVVIERVGSSTHGGSIWMCVCDCGNDTRALSNNLRRGHTRSCGCSAGRGFTPAQRFWSKVNRGSPEGCWVWTGAVTSDGYGQLSVGGKMVSAHRFAYELCREPIPDGLQLDHLCRNRGCVNPEHLEPVDCRTNLLRGVGPSAVNATKTHCVHGHPLNGENLYVGPGGSRLCRECRRLASARWKQRRREEETS